MAAPVAYFSYTKDGKVLKLRDLSLNIPTSWSWNFGDGSPVSNDQNPEHTYAADGFYQVTLTATNGDGSSTPLSVTVGIGGKDDMLNTSVYNLIDDLVPTVLQGSNYSTEKFNLIQKWRLHLQPLVFKPYPVSELDIYNEFAWPGLANLLIANLVAHDLTMTLANKAMGQLLTGIVEDEDTSVSNDGDVKKITTGPTEVEFQGTGEQSLQRSKAIAELVDKDNDTLKSFKNAICSLAGRIRIFLPEYCGPRPKKVFAPSVASYKTYNPYYIGKYYPLLDSSFFYEMLALKTENSPLTPPDQSLIDRDQDTYYYYGYYFSIDDSWKIVRFEKENLNAQTSSDSIDNPGSDFNTGWSNRLTLIYS